MATSLLATLACASCHPSSPTLFESINPSASGVTFVNELPGDTSTNILSYLYYYNGGGVAAGDVNGDGLPDLYFTSNLGANRLYLNKGNYHFEDVTARAGVADSGAWKTGVTMADVNGDGRLDIYVSGVDLRGPRSRNVLYINNGDGTFSDRTAAYGLEHVGYSTQALFFDYDGDGDLDMYLLNNTTHTERVLNPSSARALGNPAAADQLFRNDGGHFTDVTRAAGIADGAEGYGLGVVASDLNGDGCPDLYVANDFQGNDNLYLNNCDGTFTDVITRATGHTSRNSMGVDAADFDNDGRPDVMVTDMLPQRADVLQSSAITQSFASYDRELQVGYQPQFTQNTLQLNRGLGRFSEIGYLAGVAATDWSWAPLFADLDNDGFKDLFVTSGIGRRPNDLDYIAYVSSEVAQAALLYGSAKKKLALVQHMPKAPLANSVFHNNGDLTFTDMAAPWGLGQPGLSNGAVYLDLNHSGALDLVVNHANASAGIYRNRARELTHNSYLTIVLQGTGANTEGIGAKVTVTTHGRTQLLEQMPTRGFQSSVDPRLHFGLGMDSVVDTLTVVWPDRRFQVLTHVAVNRSLTLSQAQASGRFDYRRSPAAARFTDVTAQVGITAQHAEDPFKDYTREPLIPHLLSTEGPALAVGDINGDGLDDIYLGGAKWHPGRLFVQQRNGTFRAIQEPALTADSIAEDVDAVFFDANGDGHPDLYVVSGGNEFWGAVDQLQDRLYLNDGAGHFRRDTSALPRFAESGSCVAVGDFDRDGHPDLFVGRRAVARAYGVAPRSYLLHNDGAGHFRDVTTELAPMLAQIGMVTAATWTDYDHDGRLDLIVAGEWMPVRVLHQEQDRLVDRTEAAGLAGTEGWWNSVTAVDVNGDRREDVVLGNLGLNSSLRASTTEPAELYVGDFAHTGTPVPILTIFKDGKSSSLAGRDQLARLIPSLTRRFPSYASFGAARVGDMFSTAELNHAQRLRAHTFTSLVAVNQGDGTFRLNPLPAEAQFAPINATVAGDFDGDGKTDLIVAGNFFGMEPRLGRSDASYGLLLTGSGNAHFTSVDVERSGVVINGQVRHMQWLRHAGGERWIVVARTNDTVLLLRSSMRANRERL